MKPSDMHRYISSITGRNLRRVVRRIRASRSKKPVAAAARPGGTSPTSERWRPSAGGAPRRVQHHVVDAGAQCVMGGAQLLHRHAGFAGARSKPRISRPYGRACRPASGGARCCAAAPAIAAAARRRPPAAVRPAIPRGRRGRLRPAVLRPGPVAARREPARPRLDAGRQAAAGSQSGRCPPACRPVRRMDRRSSVTCSFRTHHVKALPGDWHSGARAHWSYTVSL